MASKHLFYFFNNLQKLITSFSVAATIASITHNKYNNNKRHRCRNNKCRISFLFKVVRKRKADHLWGRVSRSGQWWLVWSSCRNHPALLHSKGSTTVAVVNNIPYFGADLLSNFRHLHHLRLTARFLQAAAEFWSATYGTDRMKVYPESVPPRGAKLIVADSRVFVVKQDKPFYTQNKTRNS